MIRKISILALAVCMAGCASKQGTKSPGDEMEFIVGQFENTLEEEDNPTKIPRTINEDGSLKTVDIYSWTSGFFAGSLWYLYELTGEEKWKTEAIKWTEALDKRFNTNTQAIKSWNYRKAWDGRTEWFYPVLIDNMMNLELMFEASLLSGNQKYRDIAILHAETTMKNHYRDDYSCYHVKAIYGSCRSYGQFAIVSILPCSPWEKQIFHPESQCW